MGDSLKTFDAKATDDREPRTQRAGAAGLVVIFSDGRPRLVPLPLGADSIEIGREHPAFSAWPDPRMSRRHASVRLDGGRFIVTDLGSRNGTLVDGELVGPGGSRAASRVIRLGDTLLLPVLDIDPFRELGVSATLGCVAGPRLQSAIREAATAMAAGATLFLLGERGAGKEHMARAVHAATHGDAPFQVVNATTLPMSTACQTIFGSKTKGQVVDGKVQQARGGALLVKEVADLPPSAQAKLQQIIERREVLPVHASHPRRIDVQICFASKGDVATDVSLGRVREELYHTMCRVVVPALRDRVEEIPWMLHGEIKRVAPQLRVDVSFVEACVMRAWPGNVRELLSEARNAARKAIAEGDKSLCVRHLDAIAGAALARESAPPVAKRPQRGVIEAALERFEGNVSAASRALGVHRTQLRRWMDRYHLDQRSFCPMGEEITPVSSVQFH